MVAAGKSTAFQAAQPEMQYGAGRIVIGSLVFTSANIALAYCANDKAGGATGEREMHETASSKTVRFKASIKNVKLHLAQPALNAIPGRTLGILFESEQGPVELSLLVTGGA